MIEPQGRLPLILVFNHPWVLGFQKKYNIVKTNNGPEEASEESDELEFTTQTDQVEEEKLPEPVAEPIKTQSDGRLQSDADVMAQIERFQDSRKKEHDLERTTELYGMCDEV